MKETQQRSSLFLLELIINLFLFVICAAVCVGILLYARGLSVESKELTDAVYIAQTVAESGGGDQTLDGYEVGVAQTTTAGGPNYRLITVHKGNRVIYELETRVEEHGG